MALKGKTTIQIFDGGSGELVKEIHEENILLRTITSLSSTKQHFRLFRTR